MYYAKSWPARQVCRIMTNMLNKRGKPDLNIIFICNMPFRAIGKMAGGMISGFFKQRRVKRRADSME